jgi:hypothetical protein
VRNADGHICGAEHHRTRIPDAVVLKLRDLYEEGHLSLRDLAERFHIPHRTVHAIVTYEIRCYVRPEPYDA